MSSSNYCFLTCIQVSQEAGQVAWYSHLFQNFPQFIVIHTVEGFGVVNKAEIDVFLELPCFFDDSVDIGNLISVSCAFSKTSLNIWKFSVCVLLKPGLENFEHYFTSMWDECNCAVVWAFSGIAFLRDWNENWPFPVLWPLLSFPNLLAYWVWRSSILAGNQPWIFIGRTVTEAEAPILWPPGVKSQLIQKDPDAGKDWRQKEKWVAEDEMVRYHHWLNGHEFEHTLGDSGGQRSLMCCCPWGRKELHTT